MATNISETKLNLILSRLRNIETKLGNVTQADLTELNEFMQALKLYGYTPDSLLSRIAIFDKREKIITAVETLEELLDLEPAANVEGVYSFSNAGLSKTLQLAADYVSILPLNNANLIYCVSQNITRGRAVGYYELNEASLNWSVSNTTLATQYGIFWDEQPALLVNVPAVAINGTVVPNSNLTIILNNATETATIRAPIITKNYSVEDEVLQPLFVSFSMLKSFLDHSPNGLEVFVYTLDFEQETDNIVNNANYEMGRRLLADEAASLLTGLVQEGNSHADVTSAGGIFALTKVEELAQRALQAKEVTYNTTVDLLQSSAPIGLPDETVFVSDTNANASMDYIEVEPISTPLGIYTATAPNTRDNWMYGRRLLPKNFTTIQQNGVSTSVWPKTQMRVDDGVQLLGARASIPGLPTTVTPFTVTRTIDGTDVTSTGLVYMQIRDVSLSTYGQVKTELDYFGTAEDIQWGYVPVTMTRVGANVISTVPDSGKLAVIYDLTKKQKTQIIRSSRDLTLTGRQVMRIDIPIDDLIPTANSITLTGTITVNDVSYTNLSLEAGTWIDHKGDAFNGYRGEIELVNTSALPITVVTTATVSSNSIPHTTKKSMLSYSDGTFQPQPPYEIFYPTMYWNSHVAWANGSRTLPLPGSVSQPVSFDSSISQELTLSDQEDMYLPHAGCNGFNVWGDGQYDTNTWNSTFFFSTTDALEGVGNEFFPKASGYQTYLPYQDDPLLTKGMIGINTNGYGFNSTGQINVSSLAFDVSELLLNPPVWDEGEAKWLTYSNVTFLQTVVKLSDATYVLPSYSFSLNNCTITDVVFEGLLPAGLTGLGLIDERFSTVQNLLELFISLFGDLIARIQDLEYMQEFMGKQIDNIYDNLETIFSVLEQLTTPEPPSPLGILSTIFSFVGNALSAFLPLCGALISVVGSVISAVQSITQGDLVNGVLELTLSGLYAAYGMKKFSARVTQKYKIQLNAAHNTILQKWKMARLIGSRLMHKPIFSYKSKGVSKKRYQNAVTNVTVTPQSDSQISIKVDKTEAKAFRQLLDWFGSTRTLTTTRIIDPSTQPALKLRKLEISATEDSMTIVSDVITLLSDTKSRGQVRSLSPTDYFSFYLEKEPLADTVTLDLLYALGEEFRVSSYFDMAPITSYTLLDAASKGNADQSLRNGTSLYHDAFTPEILRMESNPNVQLGLFETMQDISELNGLQDVLED